MNIDRCYCHQVLFSEILKNAEKYQTQDVSKLKHRIAFGRKCGLCLPYVDVTLETKRISFDYIIKDDS
jgi:bacterioferritin-associated ferredoxin